jgi:hypothetical protein
MYHLLCAAKSCSGQCRDADNTNNKYNAYTMDFDESRLYYSHQQLQVQNGNEEQDGGNVEDDSSVDLKAVRRHFREFLRKFLQEQTHVLFTSLFKSNGF